MTPAQREKSLHMAIVDARTEAIVVSSQQPAFHSAHEGYAVLLEEVDELWDEVRKKHQVGKLMREEAIHVAAVALRFAAEIGAHEVCKYCNDTGKVPAPSPSQANHYWCNMCTAASEIQEKERRKP